MAAGFVWLWALGTRMSVGSLIRCTTVPWDADFVYSSLSAVVLPYWTLHLLQQDVIVAVRVPANEATCSQGPKNPALGRG